MAFGKSFDGGVTGSSATIDLTAPPTNIGTVTPPAITVSTLFRSANSGKAPFVAQPLGGGAFQLQPTDNTATGGNARGDYAVDLQALRAAALDVASGAYSFVAGVSNRATGIASFAFGNGNIVLGQYGVVFGFSNYCSGNTAFTVGGYNTVTGSYAVGLGNSVVATGDHSTAIGAYSTTKGVDSLFAVGSLGFQVTGKAQLTQLSLCGETSNATPKVLCSNLLPPSATNQLVLQNNSSIAFFGLATATVAGGGDTACWKIEGGIKRGANAASTALVGTPVVTSIGANAGASGRTLALTADTTNGCLAATVTNGAGETVRAALSLFSAEVAF